MTSTATSRLDPVSLDEIRAIAARAGELVRDLAAAREEIRAGDDAIRDATFRFEDTFDDLRRTTESLTDIAVDLDRSYGCPLCPAAWGIFPRAGSTLLEANDGTDRTGDCGAVPAENVIRAGQAACSYSWRMPPRRSCRWMFRRMKRSGSVIASGSGASGRALVMP